MANTTHPFIWVNGVPFPPPKPTFEYVYTTTVDAARNTEAQVAGSRVGRDQVKLNNLEWPYLKADQWELMLGEFKRFKLKVKYYDAENRKWMTRLMYPSDRSATVFRLNSKCEPESYKDCKCNLIDMGYGE